MDIAQTWPQLVANLVNSATGGVIGTKPTLQVIARTGWTTDELLAAISTQETSGELHGSFDLVTLCIGVNNQCRGRSCSSYVPQFQLLLDTALVYASGNAANVCVISIPDWSVTPFAVNAPPSILQGRSIEQISTEVHQYNTAAAQCCLQKGISFVDITPLTREAASDSELIAMDGLHPSAKDYSRWAKLVDSEYLQLRWETTTTSTAGVWSKP